MKANTRIREFIYLMTNSNMPIKILATHKINRKSNPGTGELQVRTWNSEKNEWQMPCFPETTPHNVLTNMKFIGEIKE